MEDTITSNENGEKGNIITTINDNESIRVSNNILLNDTDVWIDGNELAESPINYYKINSNKDIVIKNTNNETETVSSLVSYTLGDNLENLTLENTIKKETINGVKCLVYGNPEDNRWRLDVTQEDSGIVKYYNDTEKTVTVEGCCVLTTIENLLIVAGKVANDINDTLYYSSDLLENDAQYDLRQAVVMGSIIKNYHDKIELNSDKAGELGGVPAAQAVDLTCNFLREMGIEATSIGHLGNKNYFQMLAEACREGKGVIVSINTANLYEDTDKIKLKTNHYIFITGVAYEEGTENIKYFYICDSASGDSARRISLKQMESICPYTSHAIITDDPLKPTDNNTYGIGNELDNEIKGNSGNNILIGNTGNDKLYGGDGKDFLIGGSTTYTIEELQNLMQIGVTKNAEWDKFEKFKDKIAA